MISRRQFFGKAVIGVVGIAAAPFMPWEALAKPFVGLSVNPIPRHFAAAGWRKIWAGIIIKDGVVWDSISDGRRIMLAPDNLFYTR